MKRYSILIFALLFSILSFARKPILKFNEGQFRIMQLTDLHLVGSDTYKEKNDSTYSLIRSLIHSQNPDIVIVTGDIVVSSNALSEWKRLVNVFVDEKMPFAVTFGNHDQEADVSLTQILNYLKTIPYNMTYQDNDSVSGIGNCTLPIISSDGNSEKWILYLFDSGNITNNRSFGYYAWIKNDQIDWYKKKSDEITSKNKRKLPSLAFFHIPLPEHETARWVCREFGEKQEGVCAPSLNTGLFSSFIDKKDVIGVFVGHDHNNDYMVDLDGNIALAYGRKTGCASAYKETLTRGARIIDLHEDEAVFNSYIRDLENNYSYYSFEQKNKGTEIPRFNGSFIQQYLVKNWSDERWDQEMQMFNEAGMKYLIYAPSLLVDDKGNKTSVYPSSMTSKIQSEKTLDKCLKSAQKNNIKVFVGLNFNDRWWKADFDESWLISEMEKGNIVAEELVKLYKKKYPDAMYGWYWVWEVDNLNYMTPERQSILAKALNTNLDYLSMITPDMPLMLSPFMNYRVGSNAAGYGQMWQNVFAQTRFRIGDIFSPQDCVGTGGLNLDNMQEWFASLKKAVNTKPGLKFWANVETFDQKYWITAPLSRIIKQLEIVNGYVSNIICFAYSHYNSPVLVNPSYHKAYLTYCKIGRIPEIEVPQKVSDVRISYKDRGIQINWNVINDQIIDGFNIYKSGVVVKKIQIKSGEIPLSYYDEDGNIESKYEVSSYNILNTESIRTIAK